MLERSRFSVVVPFDFHRRYAYVRFVVSQMIFVASDVSSLTGWEWGEYIAEGFVIVACAGELVADLERKRLTSAHRDRVERLSTILLVAALSASLICLVRTNELSGNVIGSLGNL